MGPRSRCPTNPTAKRASTVTSRNPNSKGIRGLGSRTSKASPATRTTEARMPCTMASVEIVAPVTETTDPQSYWISS